MNYNIVEHIVNKLRTQNVPYGATVTSGYINKSPKFPMILVMIQSISDNQVLYGETQYSNVSITVEIYSKDNDNYTFSQCDIELFEYVNRVMHDLGFTLNNKSPLIPYNIDSNIYRGVNTYKGVVDKEDYIYQ